jgi:hypothetical protein
VKTSTVRLKKFTTPGNRATNGDGPLLGTWSDWNNGGKSKAYLKNFDAIFQPDKCKGCEGWSDVYGKCMNRGGCTAEYGARPTWLGVPDEDPR